MAAIPRYMEPTVWPIQVNQKIFSPTDLILSLVAGLSNQLVRTQDRFYQIQYQVRENITKWKETMKSSLAVVRAMNGPEFGKLG